jgi:hypothetical protein
VTLILQRWEWGYSVPNISYSLVKAAAVLGVHRSTLASWIDRGCPVDKRAIQSLGIDWQVNIPDIVNWRITKAVEEAVSGYQDVSGGISKDEADRRRSVANAITAEIGADQMLGEVVWRHEAEADMASFCQVLKTGLSNASSRIASRAASIDSAPAIEDLCHSEMNRAFEAAQSELAAAWAVQGEKSDVESLSDDDTLQ